MVLSLSGCFSIFSGKPNEVLLDYTVASGDTISSIAKKFNTSAKSIVRINRINSPRSLRVGNEIQVPYVKSPNSGAASSSKVRLNDARYFIGRLYWPLDDGQITSTFGPRGKEFHDGVDIGAKKGTPIYAAHQGIVVYSGAGLSGYGNIIVIKGEGLVTVYAHNRKNMVQVRDGVLKGELIAEVGDTGHATAPHLHFETRVADNMGKKVAVDPLLFFPAAEDSERYYEEHTAFRR